MDSQAAPPVLKPSPTTIRFSFSAYDLIKCRIWVQYHHRLLLGVTLFFSVLVPIQNWNSPAIQEISILAKIFTFVFMAGIMFCFIAALNILFQVILVVSAKNKGMVGVHEIELGDDCLTEKTEDNASSHRWTAYHKTRTSRNYLFLFVTDNNVIYVPKCCFPSVEALNQFISEVRTRSGKH